MHPRHSLPASLAAGLATLSLVVLVAAPVAAHFEWVRPFVAFRAFALALLLSPVVLVLALIGLLRTRGSTDRLGRGRAWFGLGVGASLLALFVLLTLPARNLPRINDITTNPDDPPSFVALAEVPENLGRDMRYPGRTFADAQREAYPDLAPLRVAAPPERVLGAAEQAARDLGWIVVAVVPEEGRLEAMERSRVFRFVDDVVVRVRPGPDGGAVVDVRSKSRDGVGDLGANAERIRRFLRALEERV